MLSSVVAAFWLLYTLQSEEGSTLFFHAAGGAAAFLFFWLLWRVSDGRWLGYGDVKLAMPLGLLVGIGGVFSFIAFSFWIGAAISLLLMAFSSMLASGQSGLRFSRGPIRMKSEVPFAPFLILAFALVFLFEADVLALVTYALS